MSRTLRPRRFLPVLLSVALATPLLAQESRHPGRSGPRKLLARAEEIALARSAAPAAVSDSAAVWVFTDTGYVIAERGTSGNACYVSRSWPTSIEPHCFDAEGAATIMPLHMHEVLLLHRGMTPTDAEREIGALIASGKLKLPRKPSMSYMMSAGQQLISDEGNPAGRWQPHVMIYYPWLESAQLGMRTPDPRAGMITGSGTATSSIMLVMPEFVPVRPPPGSQR